MSLKVTAAETDLENGNNQRGWVETKKVHQFSFFEKAVLKFSPASESQHLRPRGSLCQQLGELRLPFKHSRQSFHFHFCSSSQKLLPLSCCCPPLPSLGSSEVSSSCHRWPGSMFRLFMFENSTFLIWKTVMAPARLWSDQYVKYLPLKCFSWRFKIKSQTPMVINKSSGARSWSVVSSSHLLKIFGRILNTKCERPQTASPSCRHGIFYISAPFPILVEHPECWTVIFLKQWVQFCHFIFIVLHLCGHQCDISITDQPTPAAKGAYKRTVSWGINYKHLHVTDETGVTGGVPPGKSGAFWWDTWSSLETPARRGGGCAMVSSGQIYNRCGNCRQETFVRRDSSDNSHDPH